MSPTLLQPIDPLGESAPFEVPDGVGAASGGTGINQRPSLAPTASVAAAQIERQRIAQALHDTVSQTLTGTYLQALVTARKLEASGSEAAVDVAHLTEMIHQAVVELQSVVRTLQFESEPEAAA